MTRLDVLASALLCASALSAQQTEVRRGEVLPSYKDLKFAPLPPIKVPEPASVTLPNGLRIFLLENHELPTVSGFALVRTGNLFDPAGKHGLAEVTGSVLRSGGSRAHTGDQIDEQLENVAASVESSIGESYGTVAFSCLKENTGQVLDIFRDLLTTPEFRQDKLDLIKKQVRSGIARRNDDANGIVDREFPAVVYGRTTPYGWSIEYADIDSIQRPDLVQFYQRYYFPANIMLAVYGDFDTAEMKQRLTNLFSAWQVTQPPVPKFPDVSAVAVPGVYLANKSDVTQTFFTIGHLGGVLNDKDYPALEVASEILGGGFSSRLFQRIRTKLGYAYNIGAGWEANYDHPGLFKISGSTQSAHTVDTLRAAIEELDRLRATPVTDQELQVAKDGILNGFVFNFDKPSKTLNRLMVYEYFGYPRDFVFAYQKGIAAVTKADVLRVAKEYLRPQDLTIVAVGNPQDFKTPLGELGLKVLPIDLSIPDAKGTGPAAKMDAAQGRRLLGRVQQAMGGADRLAAIKDLTYNAEVTIYTPGAAMKAKQKNSYVLPSSLRQELEAPFGKQVVFSNSTGGWIMSPAGTQAMPPAVLKQVQGELFRLLFRLALCTGCVVNGTGENTVELTGANGETARLEIDPKTGLPAKLLYEDNTENVYSEWRETGAVQCPTHWTVMRGGQKFAEISVQDYVLNGGLTDQDLSKKQ
jgi:zinc protease